MDSRSLQLFLSLSETLHFGRSSEACHVSPSTLSRSLKQLEDDLGVRLFERDNRTVTLTHEGRLFQHYAREALAQWDLIRNSLLAEADELHGEISMYCSVTASYSFLYEILSRFRHQYPRIEIKLHTGDPDQSIARAQAGDEDIAIAARPDNLPAGLDFKPIAESSLLFIAPTGDLGFELPPAGHSNADDWSEVPMILPEGGVARDRVDEWFRALAVKPRIYAQIAGNEAIVSMVSLGFGIGVVPRIVLDNSPLAERVKVLDVRPELAPLEVGLFALQKKLKNPLIRAFWAQLQG
ncbi:transcriptional regulator IlvY [Marinobacterium nitratireducens]|uniref:Transcriptional regulator IlvY n=1 Tax=Marinobacterium nitratireducens TaxID=518897 RepID=A0A917Z820_9GAMM|nr:HTH-type transcriptional activator IlvY [Marinobacterium nitratireducens]GGO77671.1 transcriptional regulator IlvY [Marinobacterium nitratireducens]